MNSRIVEIFRRPNTSSLPDEVFLDAKRKIGSVFNGNGKPLIGLSLSEIKKYMPAVIGVADSDPTFYRQVDRYFLNISINIPTEGTKLDVSTDDNGEPINVVDWIKFKYVKVYPYCAKDQHSLVRASKFYILDRQEELDKKHIASSKRKEAYKTLLGLSQKEQDFLLTLMGYKVELLDAKQKEITIEGEVDKDPSTFISLASDKNLELKALVEQLISAEVLRRIGTSIINGDETIGQTLDDAVIYLKDKKNSAVLVSMKARLKEYQKNK